MEIRVVNLPTRFFPRDLAEIMVGRVFETTGETKVAGEAGYGVRRPSLLSGLGVNNEELSRMYPANFVNAFIPKEFCELV